MLWSAVKLPPAGTLVISLWLKRPVGGFSIESVYLADKGLNVCKGLVSISIVCLPPVVRIVSRAPVDGATSSSPCAASILAALENSRAGTMFLVCFEFELWTKARRFSLSS